MEVLFPRHDIPVGNKECLAYRLGLPQRQQYGFHKIVNVDMIAGVYTTIDDRHFPGTNFLGASGFNMGKDRALRSESEVRATDSSDMPVNRARQ